MMTYEIKHGKSKFVYDLKGIKFGRRNTVRERQQLILAIVEKFPDIQHTHILKIVDHIAKIPKKTIENILFKFEDDETLESIKHGSKQNDKRTWKKRNPILITQKEFLKGLDDQTIEIEKLFQKTLLIIAKKRLPNKIKSVICLDLLRILDYFEWNLHQKNMLFKNPKILTTLQQIHEKKRILAHAMFPYDYLMSGGKTTVTAHLQNIANVADDELSEYIKKIKVTKDQIDSDFFTTEYSLELKEK